MPYQNNIKRLFQLSAKAHRVNSPNQYLQISLNFAYKWALGQRDVRTSKRHQNDVVRFLSQALLK